MELSAKKLEDEKGFVDEDVLQENFASSPDFRPPQYEPPFQPFSPPPQRAPNFELPQAQPVSEPPSPQTPSNPEPKAKETEYVETYMIWSLINCLCCCCPLGIIAICLSSIVRSENSAGNSGSAKRLSRLVIQVNAAATVTGVCIIAALVLWYLA